MEYIDAKFPQQRREKRAYINVIGDLSKTLFKTATEADIEEIHDNFDKIQEMSEDQRRQINVHTTILNNTIRDVTRINKAIQSLTTTNDLLKNIVKANEHEIVHITTFTKQLSIKSSLNLAFTELSNDFRDFTYGIDKLFNLYPAHEVISNKLFEELLAGAALARGGLIFPTTSEFIAVYRDLCTVIPKYSESERKLIFYLNIPLRDEVSNPYELYKVHSIPILIKSNLTAFMQYEKSKPYIAISENRHYYTTLNDINNCKRRENLLICKHTSPIYKDSTDNCEYRTFMNRESQFCKETILNNFQPTFIPINNFYIYSTPKILQLTIVCPDRTVTQLTNLTGTLQVNRNCDIHSEYFTIPAARNIYMNNPTEIKFTYEMIFTSVNITHITSPAEKILEELHEAGEIDATSFTAPMELQIARAKLEVIKKMSITTWNHQVYQQGITIGATIVIIAALIGLWKLCRPSSICKMCIGAANATPEGEDYVMDMTRYNRGRVLTPEVMQEVLRILDAAIEDRRR